MLETLSYFGNLIQDKNITWGVGGSLLLHFYHLIEHPNDIDIIVEEKDAVGLNEIISPIGERKNAIRSNPFRTLHFSKYKINQFDFDIMGGFAIQHGEGVYKLSFSEESISGFKNINGVNIPLCSLEDWYILYWLIPGKQEKAALIENHFRNHGIQQPNLLETALKQPLPSAVKDRIVNLFNFTN